MAISFVAAGPVVSGGNSSQILPSGINAGDLLITIATSNFSIPTSQAGLVGYTSIFASSGSAPYTTAWIKVASSSETAGYIIFSGSAAAQVTVAYRGTRAIDSIGAFTNTASTTTPSTASFNTTFDNDFVLSLFLCNVGAATWTAPTGTTTRVLANPINGGRNGILLVDESQAVAGATTSRTATISVLKGTTTIGFSLKEYVPPQGNGLFFGSNF